jgi:hypothetical protein
MEWRASFVRRKVEEAEEYRVGYEAKMSTMLVRR